MLGGSAAPEMIKFGYDYPFADVRAVLHGADVVFGNLEGPLTEAGEPERNKRYVFRSPPGQVGAALAAAGFNVVSLANNHTMDYGVEGLQQTLSALAAAGIKHAGAGMNLEQARQPALISAGDQTVAVLAYSLTFPESFWARADVAGTAFGHEHHVRADVQAARKQADIVMVSFHWGREATTELRDYQPRLGRAAIDAGATIVLGHHPHILQGIERYKHGIIFYSLGNFAFGSYSRIAQRSIMAEVDIEDARLTRVRLVPLNVNNVEVVFQPRRIASAEAERVVADLRELSAPLQTQIVLDDGVGAVVLSDAPLLSSKRGGVRREE
jgi:poly-gamma-glutamate synthesis protein (capsule biosynthesis protein)